MTIHPDLLAAFLNDGADIVNENPGLLCTVDLDPIDGNKVMACHVTDPGDPEGIHIMLQSVEVSTYEEFSPADIRDARNKLAAAFAASCKIDNFFN